MLCSRTIREDVREELGLDLSHNVLSWGLKRIHGSHVGSGVLGSFPLASMGVDLVVRKTIP